MVDAAIESLKETEAVLFVVAGNEKRGVQEIISSLNN